MFNVGDKVECIEPMYLEEYHGRKATVVDAGAIGQIPWVRVHWDDKPQPETIHNFAARFAELLAIWSD